MDERGMDAVHFEESDHEELDRQEMKQPLSSELIPYPSCVSRDVIELCSESSQRELQGGYGFEEVPEEERPPKFYSVAICLHDREFGGPEEGGWWYDVYEPDDNLAHLTKIVQTKEEAQKAQVELEQRIEREELNKGRRPVSSVCSTGQYVAVIFPGTYPEYLPTARPQYK
jgi:hypothetical protein